MTYGPGHWCYDCGFSHTPEECGSNPANNRKAVLDSRVVKTYWCTDHDLHYPVGCASIVVAESEEKATELLDIELVKHGLKPYSEHEYHFIELKYGARVLRDGNY